MPMRYLRAFELNMPTAIQGVKGMKVTLGVANHCYGAAFITFEEPGMPSVVHTGEFSAHLKSPVWTTGGMPSSSSTITAAP